MNQSTHKIDSLTWQPINEGFVAETDAALLTEFRTDGSRVDQMFFDVVRQALDDYAVIIFRNIHLTDTEQLEFARALGGPLHEKTGANVVQANRLGHPALTDVSNVSPDNQICNQEDRRRLYSLGNRLWHTDASFQNPRGRYSTLQAVVVPSVPANTQFADMRQAYDGLNETTRAQLNDLHAHHSIAFSRQTLGFEFSSDEADALAGAIHPLISIIPGSGRKALYLASHASKIIDWPVPDGRLLLTDLKEHATQPRYVYEHTWREGDFVIWDNRATMHRGMPYDDTHHRRELRRVTTLDC